MAASAIAPMVEKLISSSENVTTSQLNDSAAVLLTLSNNRRLSTTFYDSGIVPNAIKFMKSHSLKLFQTSFEALFLLLARVAAENVEAAKLILTMQGLELIKKAANDKYSNRRIRSNSMLMLLGICVHNDIRLLTCNSSTLACVRDNLERAMHMSGKRPVTQQRDRSGSTAYLKGRPSTVGPASSQTSIDHSGLLFSCCMFLWYASSHPSCRLPIVRSGMTKALVYFAGESTICVIDQFERENPMLYNDELFSMEQKAKVKEYTVSQARLPAAGCLWNLARDTIARSVVTHFKGVDALMRIVEGDVCSEVMSRDGIVGLFADPEKKDLHFDVLFYKM